MDIPDAPFAGQAEPLQIGMLIYPAMTLLDLAGPQSALGMHGRTHLFWKTRDPVMTDSGIAIVPTAVFDDAPAALDVLFVPGGFGTNAALADRDIVDFLARVGPTARYVTSVCSGAILLGAAGLLEGRKAATHWATYDALDAMGIEGVHERVAIDGNRFTGGGVTAGIDFGLTLLAELRGEDVAKMQQLLMEYDPAPPFDCGSPDKAGPVMTGIARGMMGPEMARGAEAARAAHALTMRAA